VRLRHDRAASNARVLATVAAFSVALLPQAIQRVDSTHAWVSCVPVAILPIGITEVLRAWKPKLKVWPRNVLVGGVLLFLAVVVLFFTARTYTDYSLQSFGYHPIAYKIEHKGRVFYYGRPEAARARQTSCCSPPIASPNSATVCSSVPRTSEGRPYSDTYLYYMLPDLDPATYYIEMDPGVANRSGSGLADDLRSADIAILSSVWKDWDEPNDSVKSGPNRPNEILKRDFCLVERFGRGGVYELYRRCNK
jgi:hypothetical protein